MRQFGNYVVETDGQAVPTWCVRMAGDTEYISTHDTEEGAVAAVARYKAGDDRRAAPSKKLSPRKKAALSALNAEMSKALFGR